MRKDRCDEQARENCQYQNAPYEQVLTVSLTSLDVAPSGQPAPFAQHPLATTIVVSIAETHQRVAPERHNHSGRGHVGRVGAVVSCVYGTQAREDADVRRIYLFEV
jgi:hypothetical protein